MDADILDEVGFPPEDNAEFSMKYIQMALAWEKEQEPKLTSDEAVEAFRVEAIARLEALAERDPDLDVDEATAGFARIWPRLRYMLKEPAFYAWLRNYAMDSAFMYTYFVELSGRSTGLEIATGSSWDLTGKYRQIPPCDGAYYFRVAEPTFRSFVQRQWFSQQVMLKRAMELGWCLGGSKKDDTTPRRVKVLSLGGGLLPQIRGYDLRPETVAKMFNIAVYDCDSDAMSYWKEIYGCTPDDLGINYLCKDFHEVLQNEAEYGSYDVILATGVMSYYRNIGQTMEILHGVRNLLREGGYFVCDRQILEPSMWRCVKVLRWRDTGMQPNMTVEEAHDEMTAALEGAGLTVLGTEVDHFNDVPAIELYWARKDCK